MEGSWKKSATFLYSSDVPSLPSAAVYASISPCVVASSKPSSDLSPRVESRTREYSQQSGPSSELIWLVGGFQLRAGRSPSRGGRAEKSGTPLGDDEELDGRALVADALAVLGDEQRALRRA